MIINIGTMNKAKIAAVETVVNEYFENVQFTYINAPSHVSEQPMTDEETRQGAINRALAARGTTLAQMSFGLEGGVKEMDGQMFVCNWGALIGSDGQIYTAAGASIPLPDQIAHKIRNGAELGPIMNDFTRQQDVRQKEGAIGIFTNGLINRTDMFAHIVRLLVGQYLYTEKY